MVQKHYTIYYKLLHDFFMWECFDSLSQGSASKFGIGAENVLPLDGGPEHSQMIISGGTMMSLCRRKPGTKLAF